MLTESATDVDSVDAGELEWEANVGTLGARRGGSRTTLTSLEVEWRALRAFGIRFEPSFVQTLDSTRKHATFGASGAIAWGLFHDFPRDAHLQLELLGSTTDRQGSHAFDPGETELPGSADLVGAFRWARWTLRSTAGLEAGGASAHAPAHTDLALLTGIADDERYGFVVLEVRADWARQAPLVIAPELVADTTTLGLPFRLGVALPFNVGAAATQASYGVLLRLVVLTGREAGYERAVPSALTAQ